MAIAQGNDHDANSSTDQSWAVDDPLNVLNDFDPTKCTAGDGYLCPECLALVEIDVDIRNAYNILQSLAQKRQIVKELANQVHDPFLRRIPPEITSQIFKYWVEGFNKPFPQDLHARPSEAEFPIPAPLIISAVCRGWRQIAFCTPELWTSVNIYVYSKEKLALQQELIQQWLDRSGQLPVDIWIYFDHRRASKDWDIDFLDNIKACALRWRKLTLSIPPRFWPKLFGDLACAPVLKCLNLWPHELSTSRVLQLPMVPLLEDLQIRYGGPFNNESIQWKSLTTFLVMAISIEKFFEVLRRASNLQNCVAQVWEIQPNSFPETPILCQSLKFLELRTSNFNHQISLLDHLSAPSLDHFIFYEVQAPAFHGLFSFFTRSQSTITTFELHGSTTCIDDELLIRLLEKLSSLQQLSLSLSASNPGRDVTWVTDHFFKRFQVNPTSVVGHDMFLPYLKKLNLSFCRGAAFSFSWECFIETLDSLYKSRIHKIDSHVSGLPFTPFTDSISTIQSQDVHFHIRINLDRSSIYSPYHKKDDWIDSASLDRLVTATWHRSIVLQILDKRSGTDLVHLALNAALNVKPEIDSFPV